MKAFFFDLDGTLLDSLADIGTACNTILEKHGYPPHPLSSYRQFVGNGFGNLVRSTLPADASLDEQAMAQMVEEARQYYGQHMCEHSRPYDGVIAALETLLAAGHPLAVLSNKPEEHTLEIVQHYFSDIPFALVRGARKDAPLKPHPRALLDMMESMRISVPQTLYVGDSDVDVLTAHNASVVSVGVAWGFRGAEELRRAGADHIIDSPSQLPTLAEEE
ncbi:MAG: phosphoglycolate phosphatase [Desulfovibrio sp. MES5]|uniref:HAD family hydrolase n=1 Tax=Desulfovibrio sp. MES5 TaxID=1899016 RepID=UPI000B9D4666|nr:HAD-IA family hydrolase [Desulfovibrio sp. MES5]OXS27827.1 MAG: phosphoglycolate phosphatase [Desulfovibrio sp. MES5]